MKNSVKLIFVLAILVLVSCKHMHPNLTDGLYANIKTEKGDMMIKLYYTSTPITVANFVSLAEGTNKRVTDSLLKKKFYNGLPFHRVIKDFMIQGGDIKRDGSGNPGYKFIDEFPTDKEGELLHKHNAKGMVSMANGGANTNGSQFFITHKATPWLDGKHTVFGEVVEGLSVIDTIEQGDLLQEVEIIRIGNAKHYKAEKAFKSALKYRLKQEELKKERKIKDSIAFTKKMEESTATVMPSGLKVLITKKGNGNLVKNKQTISVHYTGYFANGEVFDSSSKRNVPLDFTVGVDRVIEGWTEGVKYIEEGGAARLFIPYELGYGTRNYGPIPGKSQLIFDIEVVKIHK
jgi:peptidyl-prolyl cis-trans isomerase A (cyclophilin A)